MPKTKPGDSKKGKNRISSQDVETPEIIRHLPASINLLLQQSLGTPGTSNLVTAIPCTTNQSNANLVIANTGNAKEGIIANISNANTGSAKRDDPVTTNQGTGDPVTANQGTGDPVTSNQGTGDPVTANQGTGDPVTANQGIGDPVTANQGFGNPVTANQGIGNPVTANKGIGNPVTVNKGIGNPVTAIQGIGDPVTAKQGIGNPVTTDQGIGNPVTTDQGIGNPVTANQGIGNTVTANQGIGNTVTANQVIGNLDTAVPGTSTMSGLANAVPQIYNITNITGCYSVTIQPKTFTRKWSTQMRGELPSKKIKHKRQNRQDSKHPRMSSTSTRKRSTRMTGELPSKKINHKRQNRQDTKHPRMSSTFTRNRTTWMTGELPSKKIKDKQPNPQDSKHPSMSSKMGRDRLTTMIRTSELQLNEVDSNVYVKTRAYEKGKQLLKDLGIVVLIGNPGSGKTTLGLTLMAHFKNKEKTHPLCITHYSNFEDVPVPNSSDKEGSADKIVVMIDDIFGKSNLVSEFYESWNLKSGIMWSLVQSGLIKFIITLRRKVFSECTKRLTQCPLFKNMHQIDLHSFEFCLTVEEKKKILDNYLEQIVVKKDQGFCAMTEDDKADAVSETFTELGFPQCCRHYVSSEETQKRGALFFKKPVEILQEQLNSIRTSNRYQYLVLLLLLFKQGILKTDCLDPFRRDEAVNALIKQLKDVCGINTDITGGQIKEAADVLCGLFLSYSDQKKEYSFIHQSVFDILFLQFSSEFLVKSIEICPVSMLLECIITPNVSTKGDITVLVTEDNYEALAERFTQLLKSDSAGQILCHQSFEDESFVTFLVEKFWNSLVPTDILTNEDALKMENLKSITVGNTEETFVSTTPPSIAVLFNLTVLSDYFASGLQRIEVPIDQRQELLDNSFLMGNKKMAQMLLRCGTVPTRRTFTAAAASYTDDDGLFETLLNSRFKLVLSVDDLGSMFLLALDNANGKISNLLRDRIIEMEDNYHFLKRAVKLLLVVCAYVQDNDELMRRFQPEADTLFEMLTLYLPCSDYDFAVQLAASYNSAFILKELAFLHPECLEDNTELLCIASDHFSMESLAFLIQGGENTDMQEVLKHTLTYNWHCDDIRPDNTFSGPDNTFSELVSYLLDRGANVNLPDVDGNSVLHWTFDKLQNLIILDTVKVLIGKGVNVNLKNNKGNTPLHELVQIDVLTNVVEIVKYLIENGSDVNISNEMGLTPLHLASMNEQGAEVVKELVSEGASVNVRDAHGSTPLHIAAHSFISKTVDYLVTKGSNVNTKNNCGRTPLHELCISFKRECTISNSERNITYDTDNMTMLYDSGRSLVKKGADLNNTDDFLNTPLHYAAEGNIVQLVKYLAKKGSDINKRNSVGKTALHLAAVPWTEHWYSFCHLKTVKDDYQNLISSLDSKGYYLLSPSVIDVTTDSNSLDCLTYLVATSKSNMPTKIRVMLLFAGRHFKKTSNDWLLYALKISRDAMEELISSGADVNAVDDFDNTPLHIAARCHSESVFSLIENGSNVNHENKDGRTPLHEAVRPSVFNWICRPDRLGSSDKSQTDKLDSSDKSQTDKLDSDKSQTDRLDSSHKSQTYKLDNSDKSQTDRLDSSDKSQTDRLDSSDKLQTDKLDSSNKSQTDKLNSSGKSQTYKLNSSGKSQTDKLDSSGKSQTVLIVQSLVLKGANVNAKDTFLNTPLHIAAEISSVECVEFLIEKGAEVNVTNKSGKTPLHSAVMPIIFLYNSRGHCFKKECLKLVQLLHKKGANLNATDINGNTPLHIAAENNSVECVNYLVEQKSDVDLQNANGKTGLHLASESDYADVILELIQRGADLSVRDSHSNTPLDLAIKSGAVKSARLLVEHGASLAVLNECGDNVLDILMQTESKEDSPSTGVGFHQLTVSSMSEDINDDDDDIIGDLPTTEDNGLGDCSDDDSDYYPERRIGNDCYGDLDNDLRHIYYNRLFSSCLEK
ncbi:uncharacterized protein LOC121387078 isoform X1 [Gigantopelta aegis]|uniref:uncharacterized protein LOC121387078 isoform X1 n=1 Tax=Gigantopelta aegis TaxID=1735272 RepID=UPI001B88AD6A|nr:uncharacterized protein LOC121387078 isoform X1 [Gigantopelta aegis]